VRREFPCSQLIHVGSKFTPEQESVIGEEQLGKSIIVLPHLERDVLAAIYRQATLVLQPSEREGFGLPVIEALACGTPVVASDLSVFREIGGDAVVYCPVANVEAWSESIIKMFREKDEQPEQWAKRQALAQAQAAKFSWVEYAGKMVSLYQQLLGVN
jgi:glycosyltransferase involved in cell wall biosynthesis